MNIVIFSHPKSMQSVSMPLYVKFLEEGLKNKGHKVSVLYPKSYFYNLFSSFGLRKWMGYIDQYIIFPLIIKSKIINNSKDTLYVFSDQAQGPWVPMVRSKSHVIHCHDFLALKCSLGEVYGQKIKFSGELYQKFIRWGFSKGKNFISVSDKTRKDLHIYHKGIIKSSFVCYNGLPRLLKIINKHDARIQISQFAHKDFSYGYIMHIGGNQYYKNRQGVIEIYNVWRTLTTFNHKLLLIGHYPDNELNLIHQKSIFKNDIIFLVNLPDDLINAAYSGAECLLFPSIDEGFGWPIIEAMAVGCPVITTNLEPMTEVGGSAAIYINQKPYFKNETEKWAMESAKVLEGFLKLENFEKEIIIENGKKNCIKFDARKCIDEIEEYYFNIMDLTN